jgi:murein L,D-transpeptidase YcbB/YkuD
VKRTAHEYFDRLRRFGALAILLPVCVAGSHAAAQNPGISVEQAVALHLQGLDSGLIVNAASRRVAGLETFYNGREYRPVWVVDGVPTEAAQRLRAALAGAADDGLDPDAYDAGEFSPRDPYSTARYDIAQSAAALRYLNDLRHGRTAPSEVDPELFIEQRTLDGAIALAALTANTDIANTVEGYRPATTQYIRLSAALASLRAQAAAGAAWDRLPDSGKLAAGSTGPAVTALRTRLRQAGASLPDDAAAATFDQALTDAVIAFQRRHGLTADGVVGAATLAALNVGIEQRIRQIVVNMERWRWLPDDLGRRHIVINIAGFSLDAVTDGLILQHMKVVVGRTYRRTPVFSAPMTYLEINPYWHVPPSIAVKDLLPKIRKSVDFLDAEGFRVFDGWGAAAQELDPRTIDWSAVPTTRFPYKLRQDPGPKNSLGQIKFMLPNSHDVYLHDTPARALFDRTVRVFSSGCIRVERPRDLALYILDGQSEWTPAALAAAFATPQTRKIVLRQPLPVHITYQTAWVDDNGALQFRDDVYERDSALGGVLFESRRTASNR